MQLYGGGKKNGAHHPLFHPSCQVLRSNRKSEQVNLPPFSFSQQKILVNCTSFYELDYRTGLPKIARSEFDN